MTQEEFLQQLFEFEIPVTKETKKDGTEVFYLGEDKSMSAIFHICKEDPSYSFVELETLKGSPRMSANIWCKHLDFTEWADNEGFVVNDTEDEGATVSLLY